MLPPKLGHIPVCLAFSEEIFFHKICPPHPNHFLKNNGKSNSEHFFVMVETLHKKFRIEIRTFLFQICFRNQFQTLGSGQTENTQITPIGVIGAISVWPLCEVQNWFRKQIWNKNVPISKLFCGAFQSSQKKCSKIISRYNFKKWFGWEDSFLL